MIVYECVNCESVFENRNKSAQDGLNCPSCRYPLSPVQKKRVKERIAHAKYECLCCGHSDKVPVKRDEYSEVKVCPECKGAFVDLWQIHKYQDNSKVRVFTTNENEINKHLDESLKEIEKVKSIQLKLDLLEKVARISSLLK